MERREDLGSYEPVGANEKFKMAEMFKRLRKPIQESKVELFTIDPKKVGDNIPGKYLEQIKQILGKDDSK